MQPVSTPLKKSGLAYWAERVLEECARASLGFDADPVHDLRVAIRRCRSMADGFMTVDPDPAWKQMKRLARPLFRSLGELRDVQVMLEWVAKFSSIGDSVGGQLSMELRAREAQLKAEAEKELAQFDRKHWQSLNQHLSKRTGLVPLEGLVFQHLALERWMEARELHRQALRSRSAAAWHQLRIGIKRLRYTAENFLPQRHARWSKDLRDLQDALGEVHDLDVLRGMLHSHVGISGEDRARWLQRIAEERQKRLELYRRKMVGRRTLWHEWRKQLPQGMALQRAAVEKLRRWAAFLDPDSRHSRLVARLSLAIYDGLSHCGTAAPPAHARQVLYIAALSREVGRSKNAAGGGHQKRGARVVSKLKPPIGWSDEDMRLVAALVRHHRGPLPFTSNSSIVGVERKRRPELMLLLGVLRLANALAEEYDGSVRNLVVINENGLPVVRVQGLRTISRKAEKVARARYLLETVCRRPILVRAERLATSVARVAHGKARAASPQEN